MLEYDPKYQVIIGFNNSAAGDSSGSLENSVFVAPPVNFSENPLNSKLSVSWGPRPYQKTQHVAELYPKNEFFEDSVASFMGFLSV